MKFDHNRPTVASERHLANKLCISIRNYWLERGYDIIVKADMPEPISEASRKLRAPIFPIRSNIGPYGYPPKRSKS